MDSLRVGEMADEVAVLMAQRFGGLRRGAGADLDTMLRRRGAALPRSLRREARVLLEAQRMAQAPRIARQLDPQPAERAHAALVAHLRPLGRATRAADRALQIAAPIVAGLLLLGAVALWLLVRRGYL